MNDTDCIEQCLPIECFWRKLLELEPRNVVDEVLLYIAMVVYVVVAPITFMVDAILMLLLDRPRLANDWSLRRMQAKSNRKCKNFGELLLEVYSCCLMCVFALFLWELYSSVAVSIGLIEPVLTEIKTYPVDSVLPRYFERFA